MRNRRSDTDTVVVPRWAIKFILEHANLCDEGPPDEGWRSDKMRQAQEVIELAMHKADDA